MTRLLLNQRDKFFQAIGQHNIPGLRWLLEGFNYYDTQRVKEVGPDRTAAEWVIRCGGIVKFDKIEDCFDDYNTLIKRMAELDPRLPEDDVRITAIEAVDSSITGFGCRHFAGLRDIRTVRFVRCKNLHDYGLKYMGEAVGSRITYLEIDGCSRITDYGLEHLELCTGLKSLLLANLRRVHHRDRILTELKKKLPMTEIHFPV